MLTTSPGVAADEPVAANVLFAADMPHTDDAPVAIDGVAVEERLTVEGGRHKLATTDGCVSEVETSPSLVYHQGHGLSHGGGLSNIDTESLQFASVTRIIVLELGVAVHSVFVGFSVGALP